MGCNSGGYSSKNCIKHTVRRIVKAQRQAVEADSVTCETSCERSIEDLLSPSRNRRRKPRHTTIPFMLICRDSCKQFVGSGLVKRESRGSSYFDCIESPVFKVKGFVDGSDNCVQLELLVPVRSRPSSGAEPTTQTSCSACGGSSGCTSSCGYFSGSRIYNFRYTGVCITVDLDCFCGISCLDPITPVPA